MVEAVVSFSFLPGVNLSTEVITHLRDTSILLLSDEEVRVRMAAGDLLGALAKKIGISIYEDTKGIINFFTFLFSIIICHLKNELC